MSGDWFHQHFGTGTEPLRVTAWHGPNNQRARKAGIPGEALLDYGAIDVTKGGAAIPYWMEDPHLRKEFEAKLTADGKQTRMDPKWYTEGGGGDEVGNVM
jgi:hypothetical protein